MKKNIFTTIENQIREDGSKGLLYDHFEDRERAYGKYFTVLAAAAVSGIPYHEAMLCDLDHGVLERRAFDRRIDEVEIVEPETPAVDATPEAQTPTEGGTPETLAPTDDEAPETETPSADAEPAAETSNDMTEANGADEGQDAANAQPAEEDESEAGTETEE